MTSRCALIIMMLHCAQVLSLIEERARFPCRSPYTMHPIKRLAVRALLLILLQPLKMLTIFLLILNGCLAHLACNSPKHLQILLHARTYIFDDKDSNAHRCARVHKEVPQSNGTEETVCDKRMVFGEDWEELTEVAWLTKAGTVLLVWVWSEKEHWPLHLVWKGAILNSPVSAEEQSCWDGV